MSTIYADLDCYYFLEYDSGEVIDGCRRGSTARFVNHSCQPNCHIEKWQVGGEFRIGLFASRFIKSGEELTYDYKFRAFGPMQMCYCGAEKCRGAIGINKKIELVTVKKKRAGGGARFVMADSVGKEAEFKGLASLYLKAYWELLVEYPMIWRERSMARDGSLFLVRNVAEGYCQVYGVEMAKRNFVGKGVGLIRERRRGGKGLNELLEKKWEGNVPIGFVECGVQQVQDENLGPAMGKGGLSEPRAVLVSEIL
jgi:hypothetical protein